MILQNALVYTPRHTFERGTIVIRDGRIVPFAAPEEGEEVLDAEGLYALPGLVDIHFHGAMGKDFCDGTEEAIQTLADFEASKGVLAICPATMTYPEEFLNKVMDAAAAHKNGIGAERAVRQGGTAVHLVQSAHLVQLVQVAPDGGFACAQGLAQLLYRGRPLAGQQIQDEGEAFFCQHGNLHSFWWIVILFEAFCVSLPLL